MQLSQVARLVSGQLVGRDLAFEQVNTDTRKLQAGDLFVALKGEHFDGHDFLAHAAQAGACAAMVEQDTDAFTSYVRVAECRQALGLLASGWCDQYSLRRVAVTGNAGKTTVKEMIACMLGEHTLATRGNFNNEIGVPLTLLRARAEHRFGVFELGASHAGEIAWTSSLVKPEVVMITNVTGAHLGGFGSMQGIADAKSEIFSGAASGALAIINLDDRFADFFYRAAETAGLRCCTVSASTKADFYATGFHADDNGSRFLLHQGDLTLPVTLSLPGFHQVSNALQALAAVAALDMSLPEAIERLAGLQPVAGRMVRHVIGTGLLVDDSYNANPGSVRAAARWLASRPAPRMLVLGGVAELGEMEDALHRQMGAEVAAMGIEQLVAVGELARPAAQGFGPGAVAVTSHAEALPMARQLLQQGGTVLVKGSRSAAMEQIVNALLDTKEENS